MMTESKTGEKVFQLKHDGNNCFLNSSYQLLFSIKTFYDLKNYNEWILYYIKYAYELNRNKEESKIKKFIKDDILLTIIRELISIDNKRDGKTYVDIIKMQKDISKIMIKKGTSSDYSGEKQEDAFLYMLELLRYLSSYLSDISKYNINNDKNLIDKFFKSIQVTTNIKRHFYRNGEETETTNDNSNDGIFYLIEPLKYKKFKASSVQDYINKIITMKGYRYQGEEEEDMKYYEKSFENMSDNKNIIRCVESDIDFSQYIIFLIQRTDIFSSVKNIDNINIDEKLSFKGKTYFLKSLIYHSGSKNFGHYINYSKKNDTWYNLDDTEWHLPDIKELKFEKDIGRNNKIQQNCYVLLYEKEEEPSQP